MKTRSTSRERTNISLEKTKLRNRNTSAKTSIKTNIMDLLHQSCQEESARKPVESIEIQSLFK